MLEELLLRSNGTANECVARVSVRSLAASLGLAKDTAARASRMLNELCSSGRAVELERIHRFTNQWQAAAPLKLRHGDPRALDAYEARGRIIPGTLVEHLDTRRNDRHLRTSNW